MLMEIVIKISEELYTEYVNVQLGRGNGKSIVYNLLKAIKNGTPLPKGHGDLIDRNDLLEYTDINECAYIPTINRYDIITTPTIIERDKEGENEADS
jgi:hypothetical protein